MAHYLLQDARDDLNQFPWLTGDSILAIVAGSEPTAAVLIGLFYELAKAPRQTDMIVQELQDVNIEDSRALAKCAHLDAVISEALRLYPALPTGGNRKTTKDGVTIGGVYIPPETTIVAPRYVISRRKWKSLLLDDRCKFRSNRRGLFRPTTQVYSIEMVQAP